MGVFIKSKGAPRHLVKTIFVIAQSPNRVLILYFNGHETRIKDIPRSLMHWYRFLV